MGSSLAEGLREVAGVSTLVLTHRGRKSGKPYEVTIWFVDGETILLPSANVNSETASVEADSHLDR